MTSTYNYEKFEGLLNKAKITKAEAAKLFKVSRPTIYTWCAGHPPTQGLLISNNERLVKVIERAIEHGDLPLATTIESDRRMDYIVAALRRHLTNGG